MCAVTFNVVSMFMFEIFVVLFSVEYYPSPDSFGLPLLLHTAEAETV